MTIDKEIQYEWARIPHFYTDFMSTNIQQVYLQL